jgi:hypothetical protein
MSSTNNTHWPITEAMDALRIAAGHSTNQPEQPTLAQATANLRKAAEYLQHHADQFQALSADRNTRHEVDPSDLLALRKTFAGIILSGMSTVSSIDRRLVQSIVSLGGDHDHDVSNMLHHFDEHMKIIVGSKLDKEDDDEFVSLSDVAMECLQETAPWGKLGHKSYIASFRYDHPEWLNHSDEIKHAMHHDKYADRGIWNYDEARSRELYTKWRNFWVQVVRKLPRKPTLFDPPEGTDSWNCEELPRYLFRVYDDNSPGINTRSVIASCQSAIGSPEDSRRDILSWPPEKAADMLWRHLTKNCWATSDNLVSWSSSFMFVIQYAIWKSEIEQTPASDLRICVVDTRDFSIDQFARDMWLLRHYRDLIQDRPEVAFFDSRLGHPEHDNGQFLSQGAMHLGNKVSVFSLQDLMSSGLRSLYPQFKGGPYDGVDWINRVLTLRTTFDQEACLDEGDLKQAYDIARKLFKELDVMDMTLLLLSFRNYNINWEGK